jgi:hypothetical protein
MRQSLSRHCGQLHAQSTYTPICTLLPPPKLSGANGSDSSRHYVLPWTIILRDDMCTYQDIAKVTRGACSSEISFFYQHRVERNKLGRRQYQLGHLPQYRTGEKHSKQRTTKISKRSALGNIPKLPHHTRPALPEAFRVVALAVDFP